MKKLILFLLPVMMMFGCASQNSHILSDGDESNIEIRNMQTRSFDTSDKNTVLRNVVSSLQDLGFVIDKADADLGTVTATKLSGYAINMTVTVRTAKDKSVVRANARYNLKTIKDPGMYQDFYTVLSKSLFLDANDVN